MLLITLLALSSPRAPAAYLDASGFLVSANFRYVIATGSGEFRVEIAA